MKYPQLVSTTTPASLQDWLQEELVSRGIDGVYTRYILSLLQQDGTDPDLSECQHFNKQIKPSAPVGSTESVVQSASKFRHRRWRSWEKEKLHKSLDMCTCNCGLSLDFEERKKTAAVECLKSASEQKTGIEKLIDELCVKLKSIKSDKITCVDDESPLDTSQESAPSSPQEQAEKYYAAFPALSGKPEPLAKLCHQQERVLSTASVWDGRKIIEHAKTDCLKLDDNSCLEKEMTTEADDLFGGGIELVLESAADVDTGQDSQRDVSPSFVIPRMKTQVQQQHAFMKQSSFTLFGNSSRIKKNGSEENLDSKCLDFSTNEVTNFESSEMEENANSSGRTFMAKKPAGYEYDEELLTNLASKFNSKLAAIWDKTEEQIANLVEEVHPLEFSLKFLNKNSTEPDPFCLHSIDRSVWALSYEEIKRIRAQELKSLLKFPSFAQTLAAGIVSEILTGMTLNKKPEEQDDVEEPSVVDLEKTELLSGTELESQASKESSDDAEEEHKEELEALLSSFPEQCLNLTDDYEPSSSADSEHCSPSPAEETMNTKGKGLYTLWENATPSPLILQCSAVGKDWAPSYLDQSHWTYKPLCESKPEDLLPEKENSPSWEQRAASQPCKINSTLTYHKGESRFVEVIPSGRKASDTEKKYLQTFSEKSVIKKPSSVEEDLLTSPRTHFQPIQQDSEETEEEDDPDDSAGNILAKGHSVFFKKNDTTGKCKDGNKVSKTSSPVLKASRALSSSVEELLSLTGSLAIDDFDLISTSDQEPCLGVGQVPSHMWRPDLYKDKSTNTEIIPPDGESNWKAGTEKDCEDDLGYEGYFSIENGLWNMNINNEHYSLGGGASPHQWKWSTRDDDEGLPWITAIEDDTYTHEVEEIIDYTSLNALKREIEEEEEQLFRDISHLSEKDVDSSKLSSPCNSSSTLSLDALCSGRAAGDLESGDLLARLNKHLNRECDKADYSCSGQQYKLWKTVDVCGKECASGLSGGGGGEDVDYDFREQVDSSVEQEDSFLQELPTLPTDKAFFSSDLEEEWRRNSQSFGVQVPKRQKVKIKVPSERRPCTYFLEGNCRRSDCRFSHDLASITCRFWEEGSCFKGITCPFLHGYVVDGDGSGCSKVDRMRKCSFTLESEADFPSLPCSENEEPRQKPGSRLSLGKSYQKKKKTKICNLSSSFRSLYKSSKQAMRLELAKQEKSRDQH